MKIENNRLRRLFTSAFIILLVAMSLIGFNYERVRNRKETISYRIKSLADYQITGCIEKYVKYADSWTQLLYAYDGELNKELFDRISASLETEYNEPAIRCTQLAPGGVIQYAYPLEGFESAIGGNLFDGHRAAECELARETGKPTMNGPYELSQGGIACIIREPLYFENEQGKSEFWGFSIVVLSYPEMLADVNLDQEGLEYDLKIRHVSEKTGEEEFIYESSEIQLYDPVSYQFDVPNGTWTIDAQLKGGWLSGKEMFAEAIFLALLFTVTYFILYLLEGRRANAAKYAAMSSEKEAEIVKAMKAAEEANRAKTAFLFNMSHDIRTPMNAIIGFTNLLENHLDDRKRTLDYIRKIQESNSFLLALINNVLEMARIESGKVSVNEDYANVHQMVASLAAVFEAPTRKKQQQLTTEVLVKHPNILSDETKIREIMLNLLSNAMKYTPNGGHILLQVKELPSGRKGCARYQTIIKDDGIGISEEFLPHLFDEFERERTAYTRNQVGSGIGMAIVKKLVDLQGGTIEVESKVGVGTTFVVTLTHRISNLDSGLILEDTAPDEGDASFRGMRILLAEDNDINADIATDLLTDKGFEVDLAENGVICVEKIEKEAPGHYDLILMDIQMPEMDGYKATRTIRSLDDYAKSHIPIVAMTANAFEEDRQHAYQSGMNAHVAKPIEVQNLFATIRNVLRYRDFYVDSEALEQFNRRYKELGRTPGYFVYKADETEQIVYADSIVSELFGCSGKSDFLRYVGGTFRTLVYPEDLDDVEEEIARQQSESEKSLDTIEFRIVRKDGEIRDVRDIGYKVFDGKEMVYCVYIVDVTGLEE